MQHAADVLGSEERRKLYDEFGFDDLKVGGEGTCASWQADRDWARQDDAEEALRREAAGLASWPPAQPLWPDFVPGQQDVGGDP